MIMEAAGSLVLSRHEFDAMTECLQSIVQAFGARFETLLESWRQQRLETKLLAKCFAGGVFEDWYQQFQDVRPPFLSRSSC